MTTFPSTFPPKFPDGVHSQGELEYQQRVTLFQAMQKVYEIAAAIRVEQQRISGHRYS